MPESRGTNVPQQKLISADMHWLLLKYLQRRALLASASGTKSSEGSLRLCHVPGLPFSVLVACVCRSYRAGLSYWTSRGTFARRGT